MNEAELREWAKLAHKICERPQYTWTLKEESAVYWWYLHSGLEDPTEQWLRYNVVRYKNDNNLNRWSVFLLRRFPTDENVRFVQQNRPTIGINLILKKLMQTRWVTQEHVDLVMKYGSEKKKRLAQKIKMRIWCHNI